MTARFCICVPARNEAARIATLIDALGRQEAIDRPVPVALCVNNSDDDTAAVARSAAGRTDGRVALHVVEQVFAPPLAHAGSARRAAMELGATVAGEDGWLLSTDADCRPPENWVAANLASAGPDILVGGRVELDEAEPIPPAIAALRQRFDRYWLAVRAIEDAIDPLPWDKPPRHGDHTGASLAIGVAAYRRAGGVPLIETGEDRALVDAAIADGCRLLHPPSVWTRVSARTAGRAAGGMAGDMQRWLDAPASAPPQVPAFDLWHARAQWRRRFRDQYGHAALPAAERALDPLPCTLSLPELSH